MENCNVIGYLEQFDTFEIARIQRKFKWGYTRAATKIVELIKAGLVYELPNKPMTFKISKDPQISPRIISDYFSQSIIDINNPPIQKSKSKTRIWLEPINCGFRKNNTNQSLKKIKNIIEHNKQKQIIIMNIPLKTRLPLKSKFKSLRFKQHFISVQNPAVLITTIESYPDIRFLAKQVKKPIEKIYALIENHLINQCKTHIRKIGINQA